ncbi:MAG: MFS transporter [Nocardioidaceae bacterium]
MAGATAGGHLMGRIGPRALAALGFTTAAVGFAGPARFEGAAVLVVGLTMAAAGLGVLFVTAAATALGQVAPHESGIASGIVSTFHEFGASIGAAVISSVAAASLAGSITQGFEAGFTLAVVVAAVAAGLSLLLVPGKPARSNQLLEGEL